MKHISLKKIIRWSVSIGIVLLFIGTTIAQVPNLNSSLNSLPKNISKGTYTFNPTDDSYIGAPNDVNGNLISMNLRNGSAGDQYLAAPIIKFNISSIPANSLIISATLSLFYYGSADHDPIGRALTMRHFEGDWNEETIKRNNMPPYSSEVSTVTSAPSVPGVWLTWDVTGDVQKFVSGTLENYGWIIKDEQYWGGSGIPLMYFHSKEFGSLTPSLEIVVNDPPAIPQITGQANGTVGQSYDYTFIASDPDGDQIYYTIEWGDGQTNTWIGPYTSGQPVTIPHSWEKKGIYVVKAKAKDTHNAESDWGTLDVNMPLSYNYVGLHFFERLFERFPHAFPILRQLFGY